MKRKITIEWNDDCEFDLADHYRFQAEFYRITLLLVQKFLKQQEELVGYHTKMKVTQEQ